MALPDDLRRDAEQVLNASGHPWKAVWAVEPDCILYTNNLDRPRTLWLSRQPGTGRLRTQIATGFQIDAPEDFRRVVAAEG